MTNLDYLVAKASIMVLYKSKYNEDDFKKMQDSISALYKDHEILKKLEPQPKVPAALTTATTTPTTTVQTTPKIVDTSCKNVFFKPPGLLQIEEIEQFQAWVSDLNLLQSENMVIYPRYTGFQFKLEVSTNSKLLYIKDKYGIVKNITNALEFLDIKDAKLPIGMYYGYITPKKIVWDNQGAALNITNKDGEPLYKTPLNALYNALTDVELVKSRYVLKNSECYISRIVNTIFSKGSVSAHLENIDVNYSNYIIPFEKKVLSDITEELLAQMYLDYSDLNLVEGFVIEINNRSKQSSIELVKNSVGVELTNIVPRETVCTRVINNVFYQLNRFGELITTISFDKCRHYNVVSSMVTLEDSKDINEYSIGVGSEVEIAISEDEFGVVSSSLKMVTKEAPDFKPLKACPKCGALLKEKESGLYCVSKECVDLSDRKVASFYQLLGFKSFTVAIAKKFREKGFDNPYKVASVPFLTMKEASSEMSDVDRSKLYAFFQTIKYSGIEAYKVQFASSCFERISTTTLKENSLNTVADASKAVVRNVSADDLILMIEEWLEFKRLNPFVLK